LPTLPARATADPAPGRVFAPHGLDDAEFIQLLQELMRVLQPRIANPPKSGRKRRILTTVLLLGPEADKS
jgi:hypothetical protein